MTQTQSAGIFDRDMNATWEKFLRERVNSFIKWDLVRFFHDNPHTADTADNIAGFIGRDTRTVQRDLDALAKADVLAVQRAGDTTIYRLSSDRETRHLVTEFVALCHNRDFRVKAIQLVIKGMNFSPGQDF